MNLDELRALVDLMEKNHLLELEVEEEGRRVKLRRESPSGNSVSHAAQPPMAAPPVAPAAPPPPPAESTAKPFPSPLVGTFYRSPKPDAEPFVDVGDAVEPNTVLCIIEAMKVMNEIKAETKGRIREILVKNGQAVEFGEPLFLIEPA